MASRIIAPRAVAADEPGVSGLTIIIDADYGWVHYIGTRTQLEAEGILPGEPCWPDGFARSDGEANGIHFTLKRERPEGAKGPRRDFIDSDNWRLTMSRVNAPSVQDCQLRMKVKEIRRLVYEQTREGEAARRKLWARYGEAERDVAFQAFKSLIPGLVPPPRKPRGAKRSPNSEARHG